jgi:predicted ATPase
MEKNVEDRYQTAFGLLHDLDKCLQILESKNAQIYFEIRQRDLSGTFQIGQKLYGREAEINTILASFDECANGKSQLLLIAGYSGTGKTSLVHEVHRPITLKNGYYSEWKFDQFSKSTPYSAFLHIFSNLIDTLLSEEETALDKIATEIKRAIGLEGKVLTDLLPNLEHIIGPQSPIPALGGEEASRRLTYLIQSIHSFFLLMICNGLMPPPCFC